MAVVVFTSSKDLRNVETAYRLAANSFLMKPLELETHTGLLNALKAYGRFEVDGTPRPGVSKTHAGGWRKAA